MSILISLVVGLVILGLLLWVITQLPMVDPAIVKVIRVVIIVVAVLWVLGALTGYGPIFPMEHWSRRG